MFDCQRVPLFSDPEDHSLMKSPHHEAKITALASTGTSGCCERADRVGSSGFSKDCNGAIVFKGEKGVGYDGYIGGSPRMVGFWCFLENVLSLTILD